MSRRHTLLSTAAVLTALLLGACSGTPKMPEEPITLGTGAQGGAFYDYGPGIANIVTEVTGLPIVIRITAGSVENVQRVNAGTMETALANMGPAFEGWTGSEKWTEGKQMRDMRALLPMYETPFHVAALRASGITTMKQLDKKRVGVGPQGGPAELIFRGFAEQLGIKPVIVNGSPTEMGKLALDGKIDAFWYGSGLPLDPMTQMAKAQPTVIFGFTDEESAVIRKRFPYLAANVIPANTYPGQAAPVRTVAVWNFIIAHKSVPDATAYWFVKAVLDNPEKVAKAHPAASATVTKNATANTFMTFHPGAVRYYREVGVALPAELAP
jgi:TRAP transporter TAXI family solute receptor